MSKRLHIAEHLNLPLDTVTQAIAILARRSAGKTYCAKGGWSLESVRADF